MPIKRGTGKAGTGQGVLYEQTVGVLLGGTQGTLFGRGGGGGGNQ